MAKSDKPRERVFFDQVETWDNDPRFETRLEHAFLRVRQILSDGRVIVVALFFFFLCMFTIVSVEKSRLIDGLLSLAAACIVSYVGTVVTVYWNLDSVYGRKWQMFFDKWYAINMMEKDPRSPTIKYHFCNLYMDAIVMKLWGDPGISANFKDALIEAIEETSKTAKKDIGRLNTGELTTGEGLRFFSKFAHLLEDKIDKKLRPNQDEDANPPIINAS